ncbi:hypothetical protein GYMLUDRAFT_34152 [Collybiopsis luxurians FD-317 M1]|nr:hypothetical protein GYMLUDRAFT_34152 [Collybiopsis luxurians FD-317 M1]
MIAADIEILPLTAKQLPSYESVNSPPPTYSSDPICGEQSIQLTPRARSRPTGTFAHKAGSATVVFMDQVEGATAPEYGRQGIVNGIISLRSREAVSEVKVKLHGHMDLVLCGNNSQSTKLVDYAYTVWEHQPDMGGAAAACPSELPFTCIFPPTFKDRIGRETPLPPSMNATYPGSTGLIASCVYTLTIKVVKGRSRNFFMQSKKITIPLHYHPRSRGPPSYLGPHPDLFSDVKISPEGWYQTMATIRSRRPTVTSPAQCHLFIPSVKVFALSETIPFHVQLTGELSSLRQLVYAKPSRFESSAKFAPKIRVYLLRQITVDVCGQKGWKNITLAEGALTPRPPPIATSSGGVEESLDWEGTIHCDESLSLGVSGFITGDLMIKDFIVLSISPPDPMKSDLLSVQVPVTIKLVTDRAEVQRDD